MSLRIVIWNCNMALHKKVEPLMALKPDMAIKRGRAKTVDHARLHQIH